MTLLAPGPEGAVPTARFEMLREGVQECEARLFIEKALAGGRLPAALAGKCRALLKERHEGLLLSYPTYKDWNQYRYVSSLASTESYEAYLKLGWQKRSDGLYSAAAEVARAVGR